MAEKERVWSILSITGILLITAIPTTFQDASSFVLPGLSEEMEVDIDRTTMADSQAGQIKLSVKVRYQTELSSANKIPLKYAYIKSVPDDDFQQLDGDHFTGPDGCEIFLFSGTNGFSLAIALFLYLIDPRPVGARGSVSDSSDCLYYASSGGYTYNDNSDYQVDILIADSGDSEESNTGAAAIYETLQESTRSALGSAFQDAFWSNRFVEIRWPCEGSSSLFPVENDWSKLNISSDYFLDDEEDSWSVGYDDVRHAIGHYVQYVLGYEKIWWPDGDPGSVCWDSEISPSLDGEAEEWAFVEGFGYNFAVFADESRDDILYTDACPDGFHVEKYRWDEKRYESGINTGLLGERTPGCIAGALWDLTDGDSVFDGTPGIDDDWVIPGTGQQANFSRVWEGIRQGRYPNSIQYNITTFWDHWQWSWSPGDDEWAVEQLFMANNIGRFNYGIIPNLQYDEFPDIQITNFQILGMNVQTKPIVDQYVLIRYQITNCGENNVTFDSDLGYFICIKNPGQTILSSGVNNGEDNILEPGGTVISTHNISAMDGTGIYKYWPTFAIEGQQFNPPTSEPDLPDRIDVTYYDHILWAENFTQGIPQDWTSGNNVDSNIRWGKIIYDGLDCIYSKDTQVGTYGFNTQPYLLNNYNPPKVLNLELYFTYQSCISPYHCETSPLDFFSIVYYQSSQFIYIKKYDNTTDTELWSYESVKIPYSFHRGTYSTSVGFLFYSDSKTASNNENHYITYNIHIGAFITGVYLRCGYYPYPPPADS